MDEDTAKKLAKEYLAGQIQLMLHEEMPSGVNIYNFNLADEYLFSYKFATPTMMGGSNYISVSRITGKVRGRGFLGE
ncbi:unnamed protein product [marine sediment metagenome]|uniref:Uncharacterized protein n=1 Tax=marine sediment metagenome TaxID=412755 RepID=X1BEZ2_9ZZZZ